MKYIKVKTKNPYNVIIGKGAISKLRDYCWGYGKVLIVSDEKVYSDYGEYVKSVVGNDDKIIIYKIPCGEQCKTAEQANKLLSLLEENNFLKTDVVLALGGGATSDLVGFCAGIYKRGIAYINIPTTALSMADASVGGKTAIDVNGKKNLIGVIHQPVAVLCDLNVLGSLSDKEIKSGFGEIIKCGVIGDGKSFRKAVNSKLSLKEGIISAVKVKSEIVKKDETEKNKRRLLNFGHTFGHAIESVSNFEISHGEAVGMGMIIACKVAEKMGVSKGIKEKISTALIKNGLKDKPDIPMDKIIEYINFDKKREGEFINMVLPLRIGRCKIYRISLDKIKEAVLGR